MRATSGEQDDARIQPARGWRILRMVSKIPTTPFSHCPHMTTSLAPPIATIPWGLKLHISIRHSRVPRVRLRDGVTPSTATLFTWVGMRRRLYATSHLLRLTRRVSRRQVSSTRPHGVMRLPAHRLHTPAPSTQLPVLLLRRTLTFKYLMRSQTRLIISKCTATLQPITQQQHRPKLTRV